MTLADEREAVARRLRDLRDLAMSEAMAADSGREHKAWADAARTWTELLVKIEGTDDIEGVRAILDAVAGVR